MKNIPLPDSKIKFIKAIQALTPGDEIIVTRRGVPIAKMVGLSEQPVPSSRDMVARIRARAKKMRLGFTADDFTQLAKVGRR